MIEQNDFLTGLTGTAQASGRTIIIPISAAPLAFEGNKTFRIRLRKDNAFGQTISLSPNLTLLDTSSISSVTANVNTLDEGQSVVITLTTQNVPNGANLFYTIVGNSANVDQEDLDLFQGNVTIVNNTGTITVNAIADFSAYFDEDESFVVQLRAGSEIGRLVGNSEVISIIDTSNAARFSSFTLNRDTTLSQGNIYESESFTIDITALGGEGPNSGNLFYTIAGNADIIGETSGRIIISNNFGRSNVLIFESTVPAGETRLSNISIHVNSTTGATVGSTLLTTRNYVSGTISPKVSIANNISPNVINALGQSIVKFNVDLTNSYDGESLYYNTSGNANIQSGTFSVTSNVGIIDLVMDDTDAIKVLNLSVYRDSNLNLLLGTSNSSVQITPRNESLIGIIAPSKNNIVEGEGLPFRFVTSFGTRGSKVFYYEVQTSANIQNSLTGTANSLSNLLIVPETNVPVGTTYPITVTIKDTNSGGPVLYTSDTFSVTNYSGQSGLSFVTPVVTGLTANTSTSTGSISFTLTTVGGSTLETLYTAPNVFPGYSITFTPSDRTANVSSNSNTFIYSHSGVGEFTLQVRRAANTPVLLETTPITASEIIGTGGGNIFASGQFVTHVFTSSGTFGAPRTLSNVQIFLAAGGGGGASNIPSITTPQGYYGSGGGGGGGGTVNYTGTVSSGSYPVSIGAGGTGAPSGSTSNGTNGGNTTGFGLTALGGGRGGTTGNNNKLSQPGGSGGGGSATPVQVPGINDWESNPGGLGIQTTSPAISADSRTFGGGNSAGVQRAGDVAAPPGGNSPAPNGSFLVPSVFGSPSTLGSQYRYFGGGGNGGAFYREVGDAGAAFSGRGGGGRGQSAPVFGGTYSLGAGAAGGSGIVIVRYNVLENQ